MRLTKLIDSSIHELVDFAGLNTIISSGQCGGGALPVISRNLGKGGGGAACVAVQFEGGDVAAAIQDGLVEIDC